MDDISSLISVANVQWSEVWSGVFNPFLAGTRA